MRPRSQAAATDGFETSVAEKMPKSRRLEEIFPQTGPAPAEEAFHPLKEELPEPVREVEPQDKKAERKSIFQSPRREMETEQRLDVLKLIEDLHAQVIASGQVRRALEIDLSSYKKTIHQLGQDNQTLRRQLETLDKEHQKLKELQAESSYLQEENTDALERIKELQQELREFKEHLARAGQEKQEASSRIQELESQVEQNELNKIKGKMKEKEATLFHEENQELQSKLEEALNKNLDLEKKYEGLKKSFNEVRDSLSYLRDSCKANYYNLSENL